MYKEAVKELEKQTRKKLIELDKKIAYAETYEDTEEELIGLYAVQRKYIDKMKILGEIEFLAKFMERVEEEKE